MLRIILQKLKFMTVAELKGRGIIFLTLSPCTTDRFCIPNRSSDQLNECTLCLNHPGCVVIKESCGRTLKYNLTLQNEEDLFHQCVQSFALELDQHRVLITQIATMTRADIFHSDADFAADQNGTDVKHVHPLYNGIIIYKRQSKIGGFVVYQDVFTLNSVDRRERQNSDD